MIVFVIAIFFVVIVENVSTGEIVETDGAGDSFIVATLYGKERTVFVLVPVLSRSLFFFFTPLVEKAYCPLIYFKFCCCCCCIFPTN